MKKSVKISQRQTLFLGLYYKEKSIQVLKIASISTTILNIIITATIMFSVVKYAYKYVHTYMCNMHICIHVQMMYRYAIQKI